MRKRLFILSSVLVVMSISVWVFAGTSPDPSFVYRGHLEVDGVAADTPHDIVVKLFGAPTAGSPVGASFTFNGVVPAHGDFSVTVGPLSDSQLATDPLFIEVTVDGTALTGRQRIFAVPFAMRGRTGGLPFVVDGNLTAPSANITNALQAGSVSTGSLNSNTISTNSLSASNIGTGGLTADNVTVNGTLNVNVLNAPNTKTTGWCDCDWGSQTRWNISNGHDYNPNLSPNDHGASAETPDAYLFQYDQGGYSLYECHPPRMLVGFAASPGGSLGNIEHFKCCTPCGLTRAY